jgi:ABC-type phosphate transport system substrate-binding protein
LGGPDEEIIVIARESGSGTRDTFNEDIMGDKKTETPGVFTTAMGSSEVKKAIIGSDSAIGYLGFSYAESGNIGVIALDGVLPSMQTIKTHLISYIVISTYTPLASLHPAPRSLSTLLPAQRVKKSLKRLDSSLCNRS